MVATTGFLETVGQRGEQDERAERKGDGFLGKAHYTDPAPLGSGIGNGPGTRDMAPPASMPPVPGSEQTAMGNSKLSTWQ